MWQQVLYMDGNNANMIADVVTIKAGLTKTNNGHDCVKEKENCEMQTSHHSLKAELKRQAKIQVHYQLIENKLCPECYES